MTKQEKFLKGIYALLKKMAEKQEVDISEVEDPEAQEATPEKPEAEQLEEAEQQRKLIEKRIRQDAEERQ